MTNQEIFDKVATHLLTQNKRSIGSAHHECVYRNKAGLKCAIGALIPDDKYSESLEGRSPSGALSRPNIPDNAAFIETLSEAGVNLMDNSVLGLCTELQNLHDFNYPGIWKSLLGDIASRLGLSYNVLENF